MLTALRVQNFALIDELELQFTGGLNVLTGETGAGKSILIGAIGLILGERAAAEQIRSGAEQAMIEAYFHLSHPALIALLEQAQIPVDAGGELILCRELSREGRNVCRVNGRSVPLSLLKDIGRLLVDLHGQHQHQSLLNPDAHRCLLDGYGGPRLQEFYQEYCRNYSLRENLRRRLQQIGSAGPERERQLEFLRFQIQEIRQFNPSLEEEQSLAERRQVLMNVEKLLAAAANAHQDIFAGDQMPSLVDVLQRHQVILAPLAALDSRLTPLLELLETACVQLEEAGHGFRTYLDQLNFDPQELEHIDQRLQGYRQLQRKYGADTPAVLAFCQELEGQLQALEEGSVEAEKLQLQLKEQDQQLARAAARLTEERRQAAARLEEAAGAAFRQLDLPAARLGVSFTALAEPGPDGGDAVEFLFSANKGEPLKPLAKVISGGEMSRVMLALKSLLARQDQIPTLIFDEIDTGISGVTVDRVAATLARLGKEHQVIAVTHHPQIAARANCHWLIYKQEEGQRTLTRVKRLTAVQREQEIARLLDGSLSPLALEHAREMLSKVQSYLEEPGLSQ